METPIIPWLGGKRRLADKLLQIFPPHECYVEVFAGGAALYFMRQQPASVEVLNDINGELVNLYRVVQNHLEEFVRQFKWALSSRKMREVFAGFPVLTLDIKYSVANAHGAPKTSGEVVFMNWEEGAFGGLF